MATGKWLGGAAVAALAAALALGCGDDSKGGGPAGPTIDTIPQSWQGVWELHVTGSPCDLPVVVYEDSLTQDLCPGDSIQFGLPIDLGGTGCQDGTVTATETSLAFSCSGPYQEAGCTGTISTTINIAIDPNAGTMSGSGRVNTRLDPGVDCPPSVCIQLTMTGTRISTSPSCPLTATRKSFLTEAIEKILARR